MDEIFKFILELICYQIGKFIAILLFPKIGIEKNPKNIEYTFKNLFKLHTTYKKNGSTYFYYDVVTFIGLLFWIFIIAMIILISYIKQT